MTFKTLTVYLIVLSFLFPPNIWAQVGPAELPENPLENPIEAPQEDEQPPQFIINNFFLGNEFQNWRSATDQDFDIAYETAFVATVNEERFLYNATSLGENGALIMNLTSEKVLHIRIPARDVSFSRNYLYISPRVVEEGHPGIYLIRLIDVHHYSTLTPPSPVPVFFVPIDPEAGGNVRDAVVTLDDALEESHLTVRLDNAAHTAINIPFTEILDVLRIQMIFLALQQAATNPDLADLNNLVRVFRANFEQFYDDFYEELLQVGGENAANLLTPQMRALDWEASTPEELAEALQSTEANEALVELKTRYAQRLADLFDTFITDYDRFMSSVEFTFTPSSDNEAQTPTNNSGLSDILTEGGLSLEDQALQAMEENEAAIAARQHEENVQSALHWYAGIGTATLFVLFGLPRLLGRSFSSLGADVSRVHYFRLTRPISGLVNRLRGGRSSYAGLQVTEDQFQRAFYQCLGDTVTVVAAEYCSRPLFRHVGEEDDEFAILVDEPFTNIHTLWWHRNFLYHVLSNQIIGTIGTAAGLTKLEASVNQFISSWIVDAQVERIIAEGSGIADFALDDAQRRAIAGRIQDTTDELKQELTNRIREGYQAGRYTQIPTLMEVFSEAEINRYARRLTESIQRNTAPPIQLPSVPEIRLRRPILGLEDLVELARDIRRFSFDGSTYPYRLIREILRPPVPLQLSDDAVRTLQNLMSAKIASVGEATIGQRFRDVSRRIGITRKVVQGIGLATGAISRRVLGERMTTFLSRTARETWDQWLAFLEPNFFNSILTQTSFRGGNYNLSLFFVNRAISLLYLTPLYVVIYQRAKRSYVMERTGRPGEVLFGVAWGILTSFTYQWLYMGMYERPMLGTQYDLEFRKYYEHYLGDGRPLVDQELRDSVNEEGH